MSNFWEGLGIALIVLSIGGCGMMWNKGDSYMIKAKAEAKLMEAQAAKINVEISK